MATLMQDTAHEQWAMSSRLEAVGRDRDFTLVARRGLEGEQANVMSTDDSGWPRSQRK